MKKCPGCAYLNPGSAGRCHVCGRDLSAVADRPDPVPEKSSALLPASALALLACAGLFWLLQHYAWRPGPPAPAPDDENYSWDGAVESLEKMAALRYLPDGDKLRALPLLKSSDERVALAAVKAVSLWALAGRDQELSGRFVLELVGTAAAVPERPRPAAVRRKAATEAGMLIALGVRPAGLDDCVRPVAAELAAGDSEELRAAGFFLESMTGLRDHVPQMQKALVYDPSAAAKLHAACALSRLGYPEGHARLAEAAGSPDAALRSEAYACLSYSASPEAARLLKAAARDDLDFEAAESAKSALILREQLAIIKK